MRSTIVAALAALLVGAAAGRAEPAPALPLEELRAGQRGYGLSVFQGSEPERFQVEVLGVLREIQPGISMVLARLSGAGLETTGVIAGMSGSPVWVEERLVGAVAFAWSFSREAIAGIMPIGAMRSIESAAPWGAEGAGPRTTLAELAAGRIPETRLGEAVAALARTSTGTGRPALLWAASGFAEPTLARLAPGLPGLAAAGASGAGRAEPSGEDLRPGDAVAQVWIDGDFRLAATGTVTDRDGDALLAFGHPVTGLGEIELPMASAEIVTVLASAMSSFKLANVGPVVGTFERDHAAGALGRVGRSPRTVPLELRVAGPRPRDFSLRLGRVPALLPTLAAIGTLNALDVAAPAAGIQAVDLALRFDLGADGALELAQSFDGGGASIQAVLYLLAVTDFLVRTDLARVDLRAIEVEVVPYEAPRAATLTGLHAERAQLEPGETVHLFVELKPYRGALERRRIELRLPPDLPTGRYTLLVGDGASADAARLAIEPADPVRLEQALDLLRSLGSARALTVLGVLPGRGLAAGGEVLPRLPGSLRSIWSASGTRAARPLALAVAQRESFTQETPLSGLLRLDLEIRRPEPVAAGTGAPSAAPEGSGTAPPARGRDGAPPAAGREKTSEKKEGR